MSTTDPRLVVRNAPPALVRSLKAAAATAGITPSAYIIDALQRHMDRQAKLRTALFPNASSKD